MNTHGEPPVQLVDCDNHHGIGAFDAPAFTRIAKVIEALFALLGLVG
jgi:hypothetical protein